MSLELLGEFAEGFIRRRLKITDPEGNEYDICDYIDLLEKILLYLRFRNKYLDNKLSMDEFVSGSFQITAGSLTFVKPCSPHQLSKHKKGIRPIELQPRLLIFLLLKGKRGRDDVYGIIERFLKNIWRLLSPHDIERTTTGVIRSFTNTRFAANTLRQYGLLKYTTEEAYKTWKLSLAGIMVALGLMADSSWISMQGGNQLHSGLHPNIQKLIKELKDYDSFVTRLIWFSNLPTRVFKEHEKGARKAFSVLRDLRGLLAHNLSVSSEEYKKWLNLLEEAEKNSNVKKFYAELNSFMHVRTYEEHNDDYFILWNFYPKIDVSHIEKRLPSLLKRLSDFDFDVRAKALQEICSFGSNLIRGPSNITTESLVFSILHDLHYYFGPDVSLRWTYQHSLFSTGRHYPPRRDYLNLLLKALEVLMGPFDNPYDVLLRLVSHENEELRVRALEWIGSHTLPQKTRQSISIYLKRTLSDFCDPSPFALALRFADAILNQHVDQCMAFYTNDIMLSGESPRLKKQATTYLQELSEQASPGVVIDSLLSLIHSGDLLNRACAFQMLDVALQRDLEKYSDKDLRAIYSVMTTSCDKSDEYAEDKEVVFEELKRRGIVAELE